MVCLERRILGSVAGHRLSYRIHLRSCRLYHWGGREPLVFATPPGHPSGALILKPCKFAVQPGCDRRTTADREGARRMYTRSRA
jgi:hypothetical protein